MKNLLGFVVLKRPCFGNGDCGIVDHAVSFYKGWTGEDFEETTCLTCQKHLLEKPLS